MLPVLFNGLLGLVESHRLGLKPFTDATCLKLMIHILFGNENSARFVTTILLAREIRNWCTRM